MKDDTEDQYLSELNAKRRKLGEYSLLHFACSTGDLDIFYFVHDKCLDLRSVFEGEEENSTRETPLHFAVSRNNIEIAKVLIEDIREINDSSG